MNIHYIMAAMTNLDDAIICTSDANHRESLITAHQLLQLTLRKHGVFVGSTYELGPTEAWKLKEIRHVSVHIPLGNEKVEWDTVIELTDPKDKPVLITLPGDVPEAEAQRIAQTLLQATLLPAGHFDHHFTVGAFQVHAFETENKNLGFTVERYPSAAPDASDNPCVDIFVTKDLKFHGG